MDQKLTFTINFEGNANVNGKKVAQVVAEINGGLTALQRKLEKTTSSFLLFNQGLQIVRELSEGFHQLSQSGMDFESMMSDLSAITGVTGDKLSDISGYAKKAAETFGGSASQSVESYKLILSQLGPEIANVPEALAFMGNSIATLSKTMGNDAAGAAEVLTTAMNQYRVSIDDPMAASQKMSEMMNIMAAAAQVGSAELPAIKAALEQSGMAAKSAGVSFGELNAAIQVLDKAGKKASEGGVALRNVMTTLSQGRFLPQDVITELDAAGISLNTLTDTSLSLSERLSALSPLLNDTALLIKLFGKENTNAAMALMSATDNIDEFTSAVTGTTSAQDQAQVVMESTAEKMSRIQAILENVKIGFFNITKRIQPFILVIGESLVPLSQMLPLFSGILRMIRSLPAAFTKLRMVIGMTNVSLGKAVLGSKLYYGALSRLTIVMGSAKKAAIAMNSALLGLAGVAIMGVVAVIRKVTQASREAKEAAKQAAEEAAAAQNSQREALIATRAELETYIKEINVAQTTHKGEGKLIDELNSKYGETFGTYKTLSEWYQTLTKNIDSYCKILVNKAKIEQLSKKVAAAQLDNEDAHSQLADMPDIVNAWKYNGTLGAPMLGPTVNKAKISLQKKVDESIKIVKDGNTKISRILAETANLSTNMHTNISDGDTNKQTPSSEEYKAALTLYAAVSKKLKDIEDVNYALGASSNTLEDQTSAVKQAITALIPELGLNSSAVQQLIDKYTTLNSIAGSVSEAMEDTDPIEVEDMDIQVPEDTFKFDKVPLTVDLLPEVTSDVSFFDLYSERLEKIKENSKGATAVIGSLTGAMSNLAGVVGETAAKWLEWGSSVIQAIAQAIPQIVALFTVKKAETAEEKEGAIAKAGNAVAGIPIAGPLLALAAIASITAAMLAIPKFAAGGLAYGPTLGVFGEYSGAANNPEVVAPLDRLKTLITPSSGGVGKVEFTIEGRTLKGVLDKINRIDSRV